MNRPFVSLRIFPLLSSLYFCCVIVLIRLFSIFPSFKGSYAENLMNIGLFADRRTRTAIISTSMSTSKRKIKAFERNRYNGMGNEENLPDFKSLLKQFYRMAHPDLLRSSNADSALINDKSFQELNGVLSTIKGSSCYPPALTKTIQFHIKRGDATALVDLTIRTAGGDSRKQLGRCFTAFFIDLGILDHRVAKFRWNDEYFPPFEGETNIQDN